MRVGKRPYRSIWLAADGWAKLLAWLERSDFGTHPVADVREP